MALKGPAVVPRECLVAGLGKYKGGGRFRARAAAAAAMCWA